MPRYRIEYSKTGGARWLSHLELIRTFIRALRRSGLPLAFSQGFNPHPKLSYGPSLGVGVAGLREYLDMDLATDVPLSEGLASLRQQFPPGVETRCLIEVAPAASGIGKAVNCGWYRLALPPEQPADAWQQAIDRLIGGSHPLCYKRPKDGKLFDVRPALAACRLTEAGDKKSEALDLLVDLGNAAVPLRGIVETLLPLTEVAGCYEPARVTRMALLHHNGGLVNPLGERKQLWEA
ncbi:MAG: TIGR03936 family radical SAM-associated protein [Thermacetogeniaceae bacterium]|jgi:radical SAM-linked protein